MLRPNLDRPSSSSRAPAMASDPGKPNGKLLSFLLSAIILALFLSLFAGAVAIIVVLHLCLLGGALQRRCSRRHNHHYLLDSDESPPRISPAQLRKLPRTRFTGKLDADELCAICLEELMDGEWCRELPDCKHVLHAKCVDRWLAKAVACPVCRTTITLHGEAMAPPDRDDQLCSAFIF